MQILSLNKIHQNNFNFRLKMIPDETILSYFDTRQGPRILYSDNKKADLSIYEEEIANLMDIHSPGDFFVHYYKNILSLNYCFTIKDEKARGGEQILMSTFLVRDRNKYAIIFENMEEMENLLRNISVSINRLQLIREIEQLRVGKRINSQYINLINNLQKSLQYH